MYQSLVMKTDTNTEYCTGSSDICPPDSYKPDGTDCDDGSRCTDESTCQDGVCVGEDVNCKGKCGDGIKADVSEFIFSRNLSLMLPYRANNVT
jgi:hypothetical protein